MRFLLAMAVTGSLMTTAAFAQGPRARPLLPVVVSSNLSMEQLWWWMPMTAWR